MATLKFGVEPDVLIWARESMGLSREEAASRLNLSTLDLRYFEEGAEDVPMAKIRDMADVYKRPQIVFFLPTAPDLHDEMPDFRTVASKVEQDWSPELHSEFRRVHGQRDAMLEIADLADEPEPPVNFRITPDDDPEIAGAAIRTWLKAPEQFHGVSDYREIFNAWVTLLEQYPILIIQVSGVELSEMRGFSIGQHPWPAIVINNRDAFPARTFTLIHELAHVLLHNGGLCDLDRGNGTRPGTRWTIESFCNRVAASTLVPFEQLMDIEQVRHAPIATEWSFQDLRHLGHRFGVSAETVLLRLVAVERATNEYYWSKREEFFLRSHGEESTKAKGGNYYYNTIHSLGRGYIERVWTAYLENSINEMDVTKFLYGVKRKNFQNLIEKAEIL